MSTNTIGLLTLALVALGTAVGMWAFASLLGPKRRNPVKMEPFECGMEAGGSPRGGGLRIRFWLVAILFVLFDVEVLYLYPWAAAHRELGLPVFLAVLVFLLMLVVGLVYEWRKGIFQWK